MKFDPRLLRYLKAIDDAGTFSKAAERVGISQPALTNKVGLLERQLGARLVDRGRFGARLNDIGRLLLRHARAVDATVGRAADEVRLAALGESGPLVVGGTPISMIELVPRALDRLDHQNRKIRISLIEADDDVLLDKLRAGEVELMLGGLLVGQREPDIVSQPLISFPLQAVVGRQSPFWTADSVSLADLLDQSWALPASGSVIRSYVDSIFVAAGESMPPSYWSCSSMHGLKAVICHSRRVTLMPTHAFGMEAAQGVLRGIPLDGPASSRHLNILSLEHIPMSPLALAFIDHLLAVAAELRARG